jgi:hypothetical protein
MNRDGENNNEAFLTNPACSRELATALSGKRIAKTANGLLH